MGLRKVTLDDAAAITALLAWDVELALRTAAIPIPYTLDDAREFLNHIDGDQVFAIEVDGELVGLISMTGTDDPVEIGYWVGRQHWGRGYGTAAIRFLVEEAQRRGVRQLIADVFPDNAGSMRVLEKNGFMRLGEIERDLPKRGGMRRLIRYRLAGYVALL